MGLADDGDDMESATHIHSMDGEEMYMPADTHSEFEDAEKDSDDIETVAEAKDDFEGDPCWENYTMVGTKVDENGNEVPNCVPDDDVPDAEAQSADCSDCGDSGETLNTAAEEKDIQDSNMTDTTDADDGDGPTLKDLQQQVEQLKAEVDGGETAKSDLGDIIQSYADEISQLDDIDRAAVDIEDDLRAAIQADEQKDESDDGDTDEADKEVGIDTLVDLVAESDAVEASEDEIVDAMQPLISDDMEDDGMGEAKYSDDGGDDSDAAETEKDDDAIGDDVEKAESANLAKGYAGRDSAAKAAASESTASEELSYQELAEQHTQD